MKDKHPKENYVAPKCDAIHLALEGVIAASGIPEVPGLEPPGFDFGGPLF